MQKLATTISGFGHSAWPSPVGRCNKAGQ